MDECPSTGSNSNSNDNTVNYQPRNFMFYCQEPLHQVFYLKQTEEMEKMG